MTVIRAFACVAVLLLVAAPAVAQSRTAVGIGESFTVAATPPALGESKAIRFYIDNVQVGPDVALIGLAEVVLLVPGISAPGAHHLEAATVNDFGPSARSGINFWVGPPPAPSLPRIVVTTAQVFDQLPRGDGGIELRLVSASTTVTEVKQ